PCKATGAAACSLDPAAGWAAAPRSPPAQAQIVQHRFSASIWNGFLKVSLPPSSHVGQALHDSVLNFVKRHVGDCEPDELEDGEPADSEHLQFRLWRRIELESPAVGNLS